MRLESHYHSMSGIDEITSTLNTLHHAIGGNDWERFQRAVLTVNTQRLNDTNDNGWAPVVYAAYFGRTRMVKELIRRGALVNYYTWLRSYSPSFLNGIRQGLINIMKLSIRLLHTLTRTTLWTHTWIYTTETWICYYAVFENSDFLPCCKYTGNLIVIHIYYY